MGNRDRITVELRVADAKRFIADMLASGQATDRFGRRVDGQRRRVDRNNSSMLRMLGTLTLLRHVQRLAVPAALIVGLGLLVQAVSAAGAGMLALVGALGPLLGLFGALPAAAIAGAGALGMVKLATLGVGDALGGLNDKLDYDKLRKLPPAGRPFVRFLHRELKPAVRDLQATAQAGLLPGLQTGITRALGSFSVLRRAVSQTSGAVGALAARAGGMLAGRAWQIDLGTLAGQGATDIGRFGRGALHIADALRHVAIAARPLTGWLSASVERLGAFVERSAASGRASGRLAVFFAEVRDTTRQVVDTLRSFIRGLWDAGRIGKRVLGDDLLGSLQANARAWRDWTSSATGRRSIAQWFRDAREPIYEVSRLALAVVRTLGRLGTGDALAGLLGQMRTGLLPVLERMLRTTNEGFGPALVVTATQLVELLGQLGGAAGALTIYVEVLGRLAGALSWLIANVPGVGHVIGVLLGLGAVSRALGFAAAASGMRSLVGAGAALLASSGGLRKALFALGNTTAVLRVRLAALAVAQWAMNAAALANPYVLLAVGIVALVAALVVAYQRVGWFRDAVDATWRFIKQHWPLLLSIIAGPIGLAVAVAIKHFATLKSTVGAVAGAIRDGIGGALRWIGELAGSIVHGIANRFRDLVGFVKRIINTLIDGANIVIEGINAIPNVGPVGIPDIGLIGHMAAGGPVLRSGRYLVGERGPEVVELPAGAYVHPHERMRMAAPTFSQPDGPSLAELLAARIDNHIHVDGYELALTTDRQVSREEDRT